ncbi:class A beta-lactamase-related serine hydrolase [Microbacterium bovistercoris]|uniref:Class A beta-lactamase-related serine hydrolase n=1 Tax=Microbacterium bovistercoris TaxID=2293570 RepID=A0A371NPG3_9MICO|nr:serine hydrolase domain-containing protein [Microbacterium bovistercoris]REJ04076.1 class A beta-lactamase-related serine hydrolase [Microbacterium bovistercoris]
MQHRSSRRLRAVVGAAAALALILTGCSGGESTFSYTPPEQVDAKLPKETVDQLQTAVQEAMTSAGASGAIVGVWVPWSGTWVEGIGTQGAGSDTKVTADMSFRVADVTRLMTCDVLYGMADAGEIELDAPVPKYVSGVADLKDVTLLDLCNGTAGIGSSEAAAKGYWLNTPGREWQPLQLASHGLGQARTEPHTTFRDSDAGYLLLGLALERASGMDAASLIEQYVTEPLGLENTSLPSSAPAEPKPSPALSGSYLPALQGGYNCTAPVDVTKMSSSAGFTDSGVTSTIEDLGRYVQAEAAQGLRGEKAEKKRFDAPLKVAADGASWFQATGGAYIVGSMVGQHGWTPGYATAAYSDPATGFTVAVTLNNSTSGSLIARDLAWELAAIASKVPAAEGQKAPEFALPFTAEQYKTEIAKSAVVCVAPPAK